MSKKKGGCDKPAANPLEWEVVDGEGREYTIKNKATGEEKTMRRDRVVELLNGQGKNKKG